MSDMDIYFIKLCSLLVCGDFCRGVDPGRGGDARADTGRRNRHVAESTP